MNESIKIYCKAVVNERPVFDAFDTKRIKDLFGKLKEGWYNLTIQEKKPYSTTRYKHYFGCVLKQAVDQMNERGIYQILIEETGELVPITVEDLHEMLKYYFNPVIVRYQGMAIKKKGSTRQLTDSQFINEYLEKIYQWFSEHDIIILDYDEYKNKNIQQ